MADTSWIAIGRDAEVFRAFAVEGAEVKTEARAETEDQAYARLGFTAQSIRWIGEGTPDVTPCAVLPPAGRTLPVVTQEQPADVLGAWPRLWVAGFLAGHENWDGVLCIETGDASHWVHVSANEIISFASFLSLRLATFLGGADTADPAALADSQSRPERLASHLRQAEIAGNPRGHHRAPHRGGACGGAGLLAGSAGWRDRTPGRCVDLCPGSCGAGRAGCLCHA